MNFEKYIEVGGLIFCDFGQNNFSLSNANQEITEGNKKLKVINLKNHIIHPNLSFDIFNYLVFSNFSFRVLNSKGDFHLKQKT